MKKDAIRTRTESWRFVYLQLGILIALSAAFMAFETKNYDKITREEMYIEVDVPVEIDMHNTFHKKQPEIPKVKILAPKLVVVDTDDFSPDFTIDVSDVFDEKVNIDMTQFEMGSEEPESDVVIEIPDVKPEFPGGLEEMYKFLRDNIKYPQISKSAGVSGTVYIKFVVERDGSISNIEILRGVSTDIDAEALRVMNKMPNWNPGLKNGKLIRSRFNMPIRFTLIAG
jgi:protein TonB